MYFRTIWLSDLHLGTKDARIEEIYDFLEIIKCDKLYLVGDTVDIENLEQEYYWPETHEKILKRISQLRIPVVYITGNHDDYKFIETVHRSLPKTTIQDSFCHKTVNGRRILVIHGHQFDAIAKYPWMDFLCKWFYGKTLSCNRLLGQCRRKFGLKPWSLLYFIKTQSRAAKDVIEAFKERVIAAAATYDGVVCGHLHIPEIVEYENVIYYNAGDWIDWCTFLGEDEDGRIGLYKYADGKIKYMSSF